jgi:hypothetical protein
VLQAAPGVANLIVHTDPLVRDGPDPRAELAQHVRSTAGAVDGPASFRARRGQTRCA